MNWYSTSAGVLTVVAIILLNVTGTWTLLLALGLPAIVLAIWGATESITEAIRESRK